MEEMEEMEEVEGGQPTHTIRFRSGALHSVHARDDAEAIIKGRLWAAENIADEYKRGLYMLIKLADKIGQNARIVFVEDKDNE